LISTLRVSSLTFWEPKEKKRPRLAESSAKRLVGCSQLNYLAQTLEEALFVLRPLSQGVFFGVLVKKIVFVVVVFDICPELLSQEFQRRALEHEDV
jgi:hypothetical protein